MKARAIHCKVLRYIAIVQTPCRVCTAFYTRNLLRPHCRQQRRQQHWARQQGCAPKSVLQQDPPSQLPAAAAKLKGHTSLLNGKPIPGNAANKKHGHSTWLYATAPAPGFFIVVSKCFLAGLDLARQQYTAGHENSLGISLWMDLQITALIGSVHSERHAEISLPVVKFWHEMTYTWSCNID